MVTFVAAGSNDRYLLGFGLVKENIEKLLEGSPAKVKLSEIDGLKGVDASNIVVMVFYEETIEQIQEKLKDFIDGGTQVVDRRRDN